MRKILLTNCTRKKVTVLECNHVLIVVVKKHFSRFSATIGLEVNVKEYAKYESNSHPIFGVDSTTQ